MSIHAEKEISGVKDRLLLRRLLVFVKPHWKMILLCVVLAFVIVAAELARPYLIKVAIDDYINGLGKPMVSVSQVTSQNLPKHFGEEVLYGDRQYLRVDPETVGALPQGAEKTQIVEVNGTYYLVEG